MAVVLEDCSLRDFIHHLLDRHAHPTSLIICSSREAFLRELLDSLVVPKVDETIAMNNEDGNTNSTTTQNNDINSVRSKQGRLPTEHHNLLKPTLDLLSTTKDINVAFCPDLPHLHAYLSLLCSRSHTDTQDKPSVPFTQPSKGQSRAPILAILNPITLHKPTTAFSAQGLNKFFAAAVDTANHLGLSLLVADCTPDQIATRLQSPEHGYNHHELSSDDRLDEDTHTSRFTHRHTRPNVASGPMNPDTDMNQDQDQQQNPTTSSPWDEEISILNVTTKSFGAGDRGWVGRTVTIRRVAERYCRFESVSQAKGDRH